MPGPIIGRAPKGAFRFLLVGDDMVYIVTQSADRGVVKTALPKQHAIYHRRLARVHGCAVIIREKQNG